LNRALELLPSDDAATRFDLLFERVKIWDRQGQREEQRQDFDQLEKLANSLNDPTRQADAALQLTEYHRNVSN
jgi:hypothetical protein